MEYSGSVPQVVFSVVFAPTKLPNMHECEGMFQLPQFKFSEKLKHEEDYKFSVKFIFLKWKLSDKTYFFSTR